jgi:hypothetical protein
MTFHACEGKSPSKTMRPYLKNKLSHKGMESKGRTKSQALSSIPSTAKINKEK